MKNALLMIIKGFNSITTCYNNIVVHILQLLLCFVSKT